MWGWERLLPGNRLAAGLLYATDPAAVAFPFIYFR